VDTVTQRYDVSVSRACRLIGLSRRVYTYQCQPKDDSPIKTILLALAQRHIRWGFDKMLKRIRQLGYRWNHKRIHRVYCELKLNLRKKPKKRLPSRAPMALAQPGQVNDTWSLDFMSDALEGGRRFRTLNIIDDCNREALHIDVSFSIPASRVIRVLEHLMSTRGKPTSLRMDNGPEFVALHFQRWAKQRGIELKYIQPGKPSQNAYIERFNRTYREDILDAYLFRSLDEVMRITDRWIVLYNEERPHQALNDLTPLQYLQQYVA
jgi:putative transposase